MSVVDIGINLTRSDQSSGMGMIRSVDDVTRDFQCNNQSEINTLDMLYRSIRHDDTQQLMVRLKEFNR
eukprot:scaffold79158_cov94-Cyclotella_meneghiniana.AAC.2